LDAATVQLPLYHVVVLESIQRVDGTALERLGRALADDSRRRILIELLDGPAYPADLAGRLGLGKANTSNHLSCLRACGLVVAEPEGRRVRYELADARLSDALRTLAEVVLSIDPNCGPGR
jgi:DNA-binding transcriptional ArsR family regulator